MAHDVGIGEFLRHKIGRWREGSKTKQDPPPIVQRIKSRVLCEKCSSMFGSLEGLRDLMSNSGYVHHSDSELKENADRGCQSCAAIEKQVSFRWDIVGPVYFRAVLRGGDGDRQKRQNDPYPSSIMEIESVVFTKRYGDFGKSKRLTIYKILEDENANNLIGCMPFYYNMGADEVLQDGLQALKNCQAYHPECQISRMNYLPTRVIDVGLGDGESTPRLYISKSEECGEYIALSYCWGGPQAVTTTKETLPAMVKGLPMAILPQTFRDAIKVTQKLGIRFLWIDALCIIQDSTADTNHEIDTMGNIYKNAILTVAASNSDAADSGFLRDFFVTQDPETLSQSFELPFLLPQGRRTKIMLSPLQHHAENLEPLRLRAWALQESLLSSRLLMFGVTSVSWQCQRNLIEKGQEVVKLIYPLNVNKRLVQRLPGNVFSQRPEKISNQDRDIIWRDIIKDYTNREITFEHDRLPALAGIANELRKIWNDEYVAGLWRSRLIENLLWRSVQPRNDFQVPKSSKYLLWRSAKPQNGSQVSKSSEALAPSWTWVTASNHALISFDLRMKNVTAKIVECNIEPVNSNTPLHPFQNARLVLRAKMIAAKPLSPLAVYCNPTNWHKHADIEGSNLTGFARSFDLGREEGSMVSDKTYYAQLGESSIEYSNTILTFGLILELTSENLFKRIGMFWHGDGLLSMWVCRPTLLTII